MRCCVPYCNNVFNNDSKLRGISFHALPAKIKQREAWIKALCITKCDFPINPSVCSEHFSKESIKLRTDGVRRLCKDAVPLSVQVCLICLDTEIVLSTLNQCEMEMAYETLTGLSLSNSHVETICDGCAQRLRDYCRFREDCLKSNQIIKELADNGSLSVQNIRNINQNNQINSEVELRNKESETQTELNALHETIDVKYEISEEIYDIYTDSDSACHLNYETGEINHEQNGDLCTEYEENTVNAMQNVTETYAPYIEGVHSFNNERIIENVMGKNHEEIKMYLRRNDVDTVEIVVIENEETDIEPHETEIVTPNNDKTRVIHAPEEVTEQVLQISYGENEQISIEEIFKDIEVPDKAIKVEREDEMLTHNEVHNESSIIGKAMETNQDETVINKHKEQIKELKETDECIQRKKEILAEENMEFRDDIELKKRDLKNGLIGEFFKHEISERDGSESEIAERDERTFECEKCSEIFLYENSYKKHLNGCNYEDNSQKKIRKSGNFILKFGQPLLKNIKKDKENHMKSQKKSSKQPRVDNGVCERDKRKGEVRLKLSFISDTKDSIRVHTPYSAKKRNNGKAKSFKCDKCEYKCTTKKLLIQHILIHTGQKRFQCHICEYKCTQRSHLDQHIRIHTGNKPYFCKPCNYRCTQKSQIDQHMRRHTGVRPYSCSYCTYTCSQLCHLNQHHRLHTGTRPFTCKFCGCKFVQQSSLVKHLNIHNDET